MNFYFFCSSHAPLSAQKYPRGFIYGGVIQLKTLYYFLASSLGISSPPPTPNFKSCRGWVRNGLFPWWRLGHLSSFPDRGEVSPECFWETY